MFMSREYIRIWKDVALVVYFKEVFRHSPEEAEKDSGTVQLGKPVNRSIF
jgi:hypothetical protein